MKTYLIIKRHYGTELNQINAKIFNSKEEAKEVGIMWQNEVTAYAGIIEGRNFEVIENKNVMYSKKTIQALLSEEGFILKNENLISFKEKEDFQAVLDFVDVEKGEVYSFTITHGTEEAFACNSESLDAYKNNLLISVE